MVVTVALAGHGTALPAGVGNVRICVSFAFDTPMLEPRVIQRSPMHPTGRLFAAVAFIEAMTWAGLLVGMWMKYGPMANVALVKLFGPLHGVAFLVYVAVTLFAAVRLRWPWWASALALLAAIPPLVTLPLEWWFKRRGLLGLRAMR